MPIFLRIIAQRLILFILSILAFFGINPDVSIPPQSIVEERKIEQQQKVEEILSLPKRNTRR